MKINASQLGQQLRKTLAGFYLIAGEEPFLIQEALQDIRRKAEEKGFKDRMRLDIESDADFQHAYSHAYTPPLLREKRFLELHWKTKLTKAGQEFLISYGENPSPHTLLAVRLGKIDSKTEQTQWFKALEKNTVFIPIWPLGSWQFPEWIQQRAKAEKLSLTPQAAQTLAHYVEGNLQAAAQELQKLSLCGEEKIDSITIEKMVADQGCFTAFDLVDESLAGKTSQALRILRYLQKEGSEPLLVLGALMHELRTLCKLAKELKKGNNLNTLFTQYRVRQGRQTAVREFFKRNNEESCLNLVLRAGEIDRILKGAQAGNPWQALEKFSLEMALGSGRSLNQQL